MKNRLWEKIDTLLRIAEKKGYDIWLVGGCCEPGYKDGPVALADWNDKTKWNESSGKWYAVDDTMPRLSKLFEKLGYAVEWEDEWAVCNSCGKAVRTEPDNPSWKPYYWLHENIGYLCGDCVKDDPTDYLEWLSGNFGHCLSFPLDLAEHGYVEYSNGHEAGWHPGQDADPGAIAKELRGEGITDFIFVLDSQGRFDCEFSVWIKQQGDEQ